MERPYQIIHVDRQGDIDCVHIHQRKIDETGVHTLGNELTNLVEHDGCRWMVLSLGPGTMECLYSIFMAKLVMVHRRLLQHEGALILCDASPVVMTVFEACKLEDYFEFAPDLPTAVANMTKKVQP